MAEQIKPEEYFVGYENHTQAEKTRLAELASVSNLLASTSVQYKQLNMRVPLSHFNFFAQYFLGIKPVGDEYVKDYDALRNMWVACCRSLQHDVDIYHDQTNEVLFTVPAYYDSDVLNANPSSMVGDSFDRLRRRMEAEANFPELAVSEFQQKTHQRIDSLIGTTPPKEKLRLKAEMWARIYAFYGVTPQVTTSNDQQQVNPFQPSGNLADPSFGSFGD